MTARVGTAPVGSAKIEGKRGSVRRAPRRATALIVTLCLPACGTSSNAAATAGVTSDSGAPLDSGSIPADSGAAGPALVVTADWLNGSLSLLDFDKLVAGAATRDDALVATIDLVSYTPGPLEVAVAPDGKTAVVTVGPGFFVGPVGGLIGATGVQNGGTLLLVDLETRAVTAELPPPAGPMGLGISKDGKTAFCADHGSTEGTTLSVIDVTGKKLVKSITVGGSPEELALRSDGKLGVVNTDGDESIRFFDPADPAGTLTAPLLVGGDPGGSAFVTSVKKLVIAQSLSTSTGKPGYSVIDLSNESAPKILEAVPLPGVPYGTEAIPGTSHVLVTSGVLGANLTDCSLTEIDVAVNPSVIVRTISLPCVKASLPMSAAITRDGKHAFVGAPGDNSLMVVDLDVGTATRIPWLAKSGPTHVAVTR